MDQFLVDLGPGPVDVAEGDEAILFGPGAQGEPTAQEWAELLDTIHYEVVTSPRGRITRTYREAGKPRAVTSMTAPISTRGAGTVAGRCCRRERWAPSPESLLARSMTHRAVIDDPYAHEDFEHSTATAVTW